MSCTFLFVLEDDTVMELVVPEVGTENHLSAQAQTCPFIVFHCRMLRSAWLLFGPCDAKFLEKQHFFLWLLPAMEP
jgi:hypothetical protein